MSNNVDNRVVQMDFDNAKFERGVKTTLESLTKLKRELDMSKSAKSMEQFSNGGAVNFRGIEEGLDKLTRKFSTASQIWQTIVSRATNAAIDKFTGAINQIKTGGMTRAANIEQANFMLEGLLSSKYKDTEKRAAKLQEISDAAMASVDGTAYGYDEASKAAAQFYASGITNGKEMEQTLLGVAGTAAMTGRDYGDIARIFTTVSGQGRLMGEQLNQLAASGINAAATLADYLGVTEKEVREMTSKGEIDFKTFATAMSSAFGEHAKEANKTFNGALSNMKAAMNRIGAEFYTPYRNYMRDIFNAFTPVLNATKKILTPVITLYDKGFRHISQHVVKFLGLFAKNGENGATGFLVTFGERMQVVTRSFEKMKGFYSLFVGIKNIIRRLGELLMPIGVAFDQVFGVGDKVNGFWRNLTFFERGLKQTKKITKEFKKDIGADSIMAGIAKGYDLANLAKRFKDFTKSIKFSDETLINLKDTFAGLFAVVDIFAQIIGAVFRAIAPGAKTVGGLADAILAVTGSIGRALVEVDMLLKETGALNAISYVVRGIIDAISTALSFFLRIFSKVVTYVSLFSDGYVGQLVSGLGMIHDWLVKIASTNVAPTLKAIATGFGEFIKQVSTFARYKIGARGWNIFPDGKNLDFKAIFGFAGSELSRAASGLKEFVSALNIPEKTGTAIGKVVYQLTRLKEIGISGMFERIKSIKPSTIVNSFSSGIIAIGKGLRTFGENAKSFYDKNLAEKLGKVGDALKTFARSAIGSMSKSTVKLLSDFAKGVRDFFVAIGSAIKGGPTKVFDALGNAGKTIGKFVKGITKDDLRGALAGLASAVVLFEKFKQMRAKAKNAKSLIEEMKGVFKSLSDTISSYKKDKVSKPKSMQTIASGILMLAGALYIVSKIDKDKLLPSLGALGAVAAGLVAVAAISDKVIKDGSNFGKMSKATVWISAAMLSLSKAFVEFSKVDADSMLTAGSAMVGAFFMLGLLLSLIGDYGERMAKSEDKLQTVEMSAIITSMGFVLKGIGKAMLDIAKSAVLFSSIDKDKIVQVGLIMMGLIGALSTFAVAVNSFSGGAHIMTAAIGMLALAKAIDMFAQLMIKYANIDFKAIWKGAVFVGLLMTATGVWAAVVGKFAQYAIRGAASIYILAGGLILLAKAMDVVGKTKINITAWLKVPAMLLIIGGFCAVLGKTGKVLFSTSVAIVAIAAAISIMANAFATLAGVPFWAMVGQLTAFTVALGLLTAVAYVLDGALPGAVAMVLIATAMALLATSLGLVAAIPVDGIVKGILALAAGLGALIAVLGIAGLVAGPGLILIGLGLALVGVGVAALTWGLKQLLPLLGAFLVLPQQIIDKGLEVFDKILVSIAKTLAKFSLGVLALAAAALVLAAALVIGAVAVKKLGQSLLWVAGGIAAIAASIWLLSKVTGLSFSEMAEFVTNIVKTIIETVKAAFENGMNIIRTILYAVIDAITNGIKTLISGIPLIGDELSEKFDGWAEGIKAKFKGKEGEEAGAEAPKSVAKGVEKNKDAVEDALESSGGIGGIFDKFKDFAGGKGEESGGSFITNFTDSIGAGNFDAASIMGENMPAEFGDLGDISANNFGGEFQDVLGSFTVDGSGLADSAAETASQPKKMKKSAETNVDAYNSALSGKGSAKKAEEAGKTLGTKSAKGAENKEGMKSAGNDNVSGFVSGVTSPDALKRAYDAGWRLGKKQVQGAKDATKSHSPSRVFIELGKYTAQGLAIGVKRYAYLAYDSAYEMGEGTYDAVKGVLSKVTKVLDDDYEFDPTIRPVVDLTNVEQGASQISSMFSSGPFGLTAPSTGIRLAERISANIQNGGNSEVASSINRLSKRLDAVTNAMNSRQMNNYFNIDGSSDPEAFADSVTNRFKLNARAV